MYFFIYKIAKIGIVPHDFYVLNVVFYIKSVKNSKMQSSYAEAVYNKKYFRPINILYFTQTVKT